VQSFKAKIVELGLLPKRDIKGVESILFGIYDTPGYGDLINNQPSFDLIKDDISERHAKWLRMHENFDEDIELKDERIHMCLYFIAPHRMKDIDKDFIEQLAPLVTIVPVIAKSDTMTTAERHRYLCEVKLEISKIRKKFRKEGNNEEAVFQFDDEWSEAEFSRVESEIEESKKSESSVCPDGPSLRAVGDALAAVEMTAELSKDLTIQKLVTESIDESSVELSSFEAPPRFPNIFAIVADPRGEREYPWGTLNVRNVDHSDFLLLRDRIFVKGNLVKLVRNTRKKTMAYRERVRGQRVYDKVKWTALEMNFFSVASKLLSFTAISIIAVMLYGKLDDSVLRWLLKAALSFFIVFIGELFWSLVAWVHPNKLFALFLRVLTCGIAAVALYCIFIESRRICIYNPPDKLWSVCV